MYVCMYVCTCVCYVQPKVKVIESDRICSNPTTLATCSLSSYLFNLSTLSN